MASLQEAAGRCLGAALGHERWFSDLVDGPLLVAVLDPACVAAGAEGDRVQTEGDGDQGRSAQRAAWHENPLRTSGRRSVVVGVEGCIGGGCWGRCGGRGLFPAKE